MVRTLELMIGRLRDIAEAESRIRRLQNQANANLTWADCNPIFKRGNTIHEICSEWLIGVPGVTPPLREIDTDLGRARILETCKDKTKRSNIRLKLSRWRRIVAAVLSQVNGNEALWAEGATLYVSKYGKKVLESLDRYQKEVAGGGK